MGERDERTGVGRVRANAAYVAARANRDAWPRNERTGEERVMAAALVLAEALPNTLHGSREAERLANVLEDAGLLTLPKRAER